MATTSDRLTKKNQSKLSWPQLDFGNEKDSTPAQDLTASARLIDTMPDLAGQDFFPSERMSPVQMNYLQGAYSSIPIFTGGQTLFPFGVVEAQKKKRLLREALKQQGQDDQKKKIQQQFGLLMGYPAFQSQLDKYYFDHINSKLHDTFNQLGTEKAQEALNDPFNPITAGLLKDYSTYEALIDSSYNLQDALKDAKEAMNKGDRTLSAATKGLINDYQAGNIPLEDLPKLPTNIQTYRTLDDKLKDMKTSGFLDNDVQEIYEKGITASGQKISELNGHELINAVTEKFMDPQRIQAISEMIAADPDLTDVSAPYVADYLKKALPGEITQKLTAIAPQGKTSFSSNYYANQPQKTYYLNENDKVTINFKSGAKQVGYVGGVTVDANTPPKLNIQGSDVIGIETNDSKGMNPSDNLNVNLVGVYPLPVDAKGQLAEKDEGHGTKYFAQVNYTKKTKIGSSTVEEPYTFTVPFNDKLKQQAPFIIMETKPSASAGVVDKTAGTVKTDQKGKQKGREDVKTVPIIRSDADFDKLKTGDKFMDEEGNTYTKK